MIYYKDGGVIDRDKTKYDKVEDAAISFLNLAQSLQNATDERLKENFVTSNSLNLLNDHDDHHNQCSLDFIKEQNAKLKDQVKSGFISSSENKS